jgi:hypothetical protein
LCGRDEGERGIYRAFLTTSFMIEGAAPVF